MVSIHTNTLPRAVAAQMQQPTHFPHDHEDQAISQCPLKSKQSYRFGALLLVRAIILLISALVAANRTHLIVFCILVCAVALSYFGQFVHCNLILSAFHTVSFMNFEVEGSDSSGSIESLPTY